MGDDGLAAVSCNALTTPRNLGVVRRSFPGLCPYFITHNILGENFDRHDSCTSEPFSGGSCAHGTHANPSSVSAKGCKGQVAAGQVLQLSLGFSRRAGSSKLYEGCEACSDLELDVACYSCGRAWRRSRRRGSRPYAAGANAWNAMAERQLRTGGGSGGGGQADGQYGDGSHMGYEADAYGQHGGWQHEERYGEEGEEEWYGEEEGPGEEEDYEGGGGYEESESSGSSSSGEEEPPHKRARAEPGPSGAAAPPAASTDSATLVLKLEAAQANVRALEAELALVKRERDDALKRASV